MSAKNEVKNDRLYTRDHEWAQWQDGRVRVGIASYAVGQLGDITLVNIDVKAGDTVSAGKVFGTIESVKTLSDLFCPVSGKVVKVNAELELRPELVNEDCYEKGWMVVIEPANDQQKEALLSASAYDALVTSLA